MQRSFCGNAWLKFTVAVLPLAAGLAGCGNLDSNSSSTATNSSSQTPVEEELPIVVATNGILCDLTQQIVQDTADLTCLLEPGQDPHTFAPSPSAVRAIEEADLVLYGGYDFQPKIQGMIKSSLRKVAVFEAAVPNPRLASPHDHDHGAEDGHDHEHENAQSDEHSGESDHAAEADHADEHDGEGGHAAGEEQVPDPHVWHDAVYGAALVDEIAVSLADVVPDQAELYQERAATLQQQLLEIDQWIQAQIDTVPEGNRLLLTTHDAFGYYADAYGLSVMGAVSGVSTEEKPSASRMTEIVDQVKQAQVPAIFAESTTNPDLINTVARNAGVTVAEQPLFVEGPSGEGTAVETYQDMLIANTCTIAIALGGNCDRTSLPSGLN